LSGVGANLRAASIFSVSRAISEGLVRVAMI
jgi:hypothetical protein